MNCEMEEITWKMELLERSAGLERQKAGEK